MSIFELSDEISDEVMDLSIQYHEEAEKCRDAKAYLAGCIMIGASFEAMLLCFTNCYPEEAINSSVAPKQNGEVKPLIEWSLANLLAVAKEQNWLPSGLSLGEKWDHDRAKIGFFSTLMFFTKYLVKSIAFVE